jgi:hypothetical protein
MTLAQIFAQAPPPRRRSIALWGWWAVWWTPNHAGMRKLHLPGCDVIWWGRPAFKERRPWLQVTRMEEGSLHPWVLRSGALEIRRLSAAMRAAGALGHELDRAEQAKRVKP